MDLLMLWLVIFLRTINAHTIAVCSSVSGDGRSVTIYAGNYHSETDISNNAHRSGLILTNPHGATTEYLFTGYIPRGSSTNAAGLPVPPACDTMFCDCDHCSGRSDVTFWLKFEENSLFDGTYDVVPTAHTFVETPYGTCNQPWQFDITGSIATGAPSLPSVPPTQTGAMTPTSAPTDACVDDSDCGPNAECEDIIKHCTCLDGYIGDPQNGVDCELNCPHGNHTHTFDWDRLTEKGEDIPQYDMKSFAILPDILAIDITIELDYLGNVTADDERVGNFGVTYVLDFEDFDAHEDDINDPGTCQNRVESDFSGPSFTDYWKFSDDPQSAGNLGTTSYLAYPPPGDLWNIYMDECGKIIYSGIFTWEDLRGCNDGNGGNSYTQVVTDDNWLNLTGTFYVNVVSPFWPDSDYGYYRVYQILSQPFVIAVSSVVHVLGSTGINLMTLTVIAVYKEDADNDFTLVLLTETADYLKLTRDSSSALIYTKSNAGNTLDSSDFDGNPVNPENTLANGNECLSNKNFICSQLWEIDATNIGCTNGGLGTDFSGNYALTFTPVCRSTGDTALDSYCANWLTAHPTLAATNGVALNTDLVWTDDICDPIIFTVQFVADMTFYVDPGYTTEADDEHLYQVGEDYIYVEINTTFPDDTLDVFNVSLVNVRICTFDPLFTVPNNPDDIANFGCMNGNRDDYDKFFYKIYDQSPAVADNPTFSIDAEGYTNVVRFSFQVPNEVARDTLYVQAELEVALQELGGRRRVRRLSIEQTANQMESFVDSTGINHGQKIYYQPKEEPKQQPEQPRQNPPEQYYPPQQPIQPVQPVNPVAPVSPVVPNPGSATWTINLSSPWVIALGGLLGLVLTFNIAFMTYRNCCGGLSRDRPLVLFGKSKGYKKVKIADSEDFSANDSENNAINVVSDE